MRLISPLKGELIGSESLESTVRLPFILITGVHSLLKRCNIVALLIEVVAVARRVNVAKELSLRASKVIEIRCILTCCRLVYEHNLSISQINLYNDMF